MKKMIFPMTVILLLLFITCLEAGTDIDQVMIKNYNVNLGEDVDARVTMELVDKDHTKKTCELAMWRLQADTIIKTLIRFLSPDKVKGMSFLSWQYENEDNSQWLYMPGFDQVSKVSESMQAYAFAGDFSLCDIAPPHPDEFVHRLLRMETIDGHECYVVESVHKTYLDDPAYKQKKKFLYAKTVSWIRKDSSLLVKADLFDHKGSLYKKFEALEVKQIDGTWTIAKMVMQDLIKKHKTILSIEEVKHDAGLQNDLFEVQRLNHL